MKRSLEDIFSELAGTVSWGTNPIDIADINIFGDTPLHTVCTWGDVDAAKVLLAHGADVNALGDMGCVPLFNAITSNSIELVALLLMAGADPGLKNSCGRLPASCARALNKDCRIIELLENHLKHRSSRKSSRIRRKGA